MRGLQPVAVEPAIGGDRRDGLEDRRPLVAVDRAADRFARRQQDMVFDVEQPRGVVGALDRGTEPDEQVASLRSIRWIAPSKPRVSALTCSIRPSVAVGPPVVARFWNISQARLIAVQASRVSAVRTARALLRA